MVSTKQIFDYLVLLLYLNYFDRFIVISIPLDQTEYSIMIECSFDAHSFYRMLNCRVAKEIRDDKCYFVLPLKGPISTSLSSLRTTATPKFFDFACQVVGLKHFLLVATWLLLHRFY